MVHLLAYLPWQQHALYVVFHWVDQEEAIDERTCVPLCLDSAGFQPNDPNMIRSRPIAPRPCPWTHQPWPSRHPHQRCCPTASCKGLGPSSKPSKHHDSGGIGICQHYIPHIKSFHGVGHPCTDNALAVATLVNANHWLWPCIGFYCTCEFILWLCSYWTQKMLQV